MTYLVLFMVAITLYSIGVIYHITVKKEREVQKLMAGTLVAEHDPAAEVFLVDIQEQISTDPNIPQYLIPPLTNSTNTSKPLISADSSASTTSRSPFAPEPTASPSTPRMSRSPVSPSLRR